MSVKLRKRKLKDGTYTLFLDIYDATKRKKAEFLNMRLTGDRKTDKEVLRLAETIRIKRELEIATTQHGVTVVKKKINFVELFKALAEAKQGSTAKTWQNTLNYLQKYAGDIVLLSNVTPEWLTGFQQYLTKNVSANSADIYFSKIKATLHQAVKDNLLDKNPAVAVAAIRKLPTHRAFLTIEEVSALAATPCTYEALKRAFLFACYTGLRRSDVEKLTWGEIDGHTIVYRQKKTQHAEYLPLNAVAVKLMGERRGKDDRVFDDLPKRATIDKHVTQWGKKAGIAKHITFHVSRHTFATLALTSGADLYTVSKLLGHTDIKTTQVYAKIVDKKKVEAVNLLPDLAT